MDNEMEENVETLRDIYYFLGKSFYDELNNDLYKDKINFDIKTNNTKKENGCLKYIIMGWIIYNDYVLYD